MSILSILNTLSATSSTKEKQVILENNISNDILGQVLYLALSPRVKFYIKKIPDYIPERYNQPTDIREMLSTSVVKIELSEALIALGCLSSRQHTGNTAIEHLKMLLESLNKDDAVVLERIIKKDLKCGVNVATVNKVWSNSFIEETPYMGCKPYKKKLVEDLFKNDKNGVVSQKKLDGRYCNLIVYKDENVLEARSGEITYLNNTFNFKATPNIVLNGELVINSLDGINKISRYESNGLIASIVSIYKKEHNDVSTIKERAEFVKDTGYTVEQVTDKINYICWDIITLDEYNRGLSTVPYIDRLVNLEKYINEIDSPRVTMVESKRVYSLEEARADFYEKVSNNEEGTIVKGLSTRWEDGKHNGQIKFKQEILLDLIIKGFNYGTKGTKNEFLISSLNAESSDGLLKTRPTGITEKMMKYITDNQDALLNTTVEVKCSGISHDSNMNYSLLHPVFKTLRDDKLTANTLEECLAIEQANKEI